MSQPTYSFGPVLDPVLQPLLLATYNAGVTDGKMAQASVDVQLVQAAGTDLGAALAQLQSDFNADIAKLQADVAAINSSAAATPTTLSPTPTTTTTTQPPAAPAAS